MDMTERQLSSEYKFKGRVMTARVDEVSLPNGRTAPREVCEHGGGVGLLPIDKDGNVTKLFISDGVLNQIDATDKASD